MITMKKAKKKVTAKSATKKATTKKAAAAAPKARKLSSVKKAMSKSEVLATIAEQTGVAKKDVGAVLGGLSEIIEAHIKKGAVGNFTVPGLMKVKTIHKKATKARKGINPFTGEETMFKAKPARTVVKILPLKKVKEMVA